MANHTRKGTFKPGDPRINRNGRPRSFDGLRAIAQDIAARRITTLMKLSLTIREDVSGVEDSTIAEYILYRWATSGDYRQQSAFLEIAFGKPPDGQADDDQAETDIV